MLELKGWKSSDLFDDMFKLAENVATGVASSKVTGVWNTPWTSDKTEWKCRILCAGIVKEGLQVELKDHILYVDYLPPKEFDDFTDCPAFHYKWSVDKAVTEEDIKITCKNGIVVVAIKKTEPASEERKFIKVD